MLTDASTPLAYRHDEARGFVEAFDSEGRVHFITVHEDFKEVLELGVMPLRDILALLPLAYGQDGDDFKDPDHKMACIVSVLAVSKVLCMVRAMGIYDKQGGDPRLLVMQAAKSGFSLVAPMMMCFARGSVPLERVLSDMADVGINCDTLAPLSMGGLGFWRNIRRPDEGVEVPCDCPKCGGTASHRGSPIS